MNYHSNGREYRRRPYRTIALLWAIIFALLAVIFAQQAGLQGMADEAEHARQKHEKEMQLLTNKLEWLKTYCEDR